MEVHGSLTDEGRVQWGREAVLQAHGSHKHATAAEQVTAPQLRRCRSAEGECFSDAQPCQLTLGHLMLQLACNSRPPCAAAQHLHPSLPAPAQPQPQRSPVLTCTDTAASWSRGRTGRAAGHAHPPLPAPTRGRRGTRTSNNSHTPARQ